MTEDPGHNSLLDAASWVELVGDRVSGARSRSVGVDVTTAI
jgi:hypothetical protein